MQHVNHWDNSGVTTTLSVVPSRVGNLMWLARASGTASITELTNIRGGGVTSWQKVGWIDGGAGTVGTVGLVEAWWGVVTATGAATITVTGASTVNELSADEFDSGYPATYWSIEDFGGKGNNTNVTTVTWQPLDPVSKPDIVAVGYAYCVNAGQASSAAPFTYSLTSANNLYFYGFPLLTQTYNPTATQSPGGDSNTIDAIFAGIAAPVTRQVVVQSTSEGLR